jgi:beta-ureidopropionase / N-carbamoyl-L-amino-acid hydrolase
MHDEMAGPRCRGARRVIGDLRELATLTSTSHGAQRVAWGPVWRKARAWLRDKVSQLGLTPVPDAAGNHWVTLSGESDRTVIIGGHLDSVPNGGWLDGTLGVLVALEALRRYGQGSKPPVTLRLVDWADEEGARFGRSLLGSSAAAGRLNVDEIRELRDSEGVRLEDAMRDHGVTLDTMPRPCLSVAGR